MFPQYVWRLPAHRKIVYLTFDDGPHPAITPWVLNELKTYGAAATFFCIGSNVEKYPGVFHSIVQQGHSTGNHTYRHLNGWKTNTNEYLADAATAATLVPSNLFRPPYGKIKKAQALGLADALQTGAAKVVMWDVLSADYDPRVSPDQCTKNVLKNVSAGSVVVFHDSEKAFRNLKAALPQVLKTLKKEGYEFGKILMEGL